MLERGDAIPHFAVKNLDGATAAYAAIWQHRNLVLVTVPPGGAFADYVAQVVHQCGSSGPDTACVVTRDVVAGVPYPGVVIADRWGEVVHVAGGTDASTLPPAREIEEWIDYLQHRCPECEGEAR